MTTKHTPGPWSIDLEWHSDEHPEWRSVIGPIADDYSRMMVSGHIGEANARLIAAAPELLEALKALDCSDILGIAESCSSGMPNFEFVRDRINAARAAIAKAMGGVS